MHKTLLLFILLCIHGAMLAYGAYVHSPTIDEPAYLVAGLSHWELQSFELTKVSPPLVRLVAAVPVLFASPEYDWSAVSDGPGVRTEKDVGRDFIAANGRRSFWLMTIARWSTIPFSLLGALICYRWSQQLWGGLAGLGAAVLWCFCPNILAHGQLMTPDVAVTTLSLSAMYLFRNWYIHKTWLNSAVAGCVLGLAILAKTNAIVLFLAIPLVCLIAGLRKRSGLSDWVLAGAHLVLAFGIAIYILNLGYGFDGSFTPLGQYTFASRAFSGSDDQFALGNRFRGLWIGRLLVPVPRPFLEGIDLQKKDFENPQAHEKTYFRGEWYDHGWWWYYLYVIGVKVPLGTLVMILAAVFAFAFRKDGICGLLNPDYLFLGLPSFCLFALASSQTGIGHGLRYVLPAFPYAFVFASGLLCVKVSGRLLSTFSLILVVIHVVSSIFVYPHSLSYFNVLADGPRNGHAHLLDGNLDWGQNLLYLEKWINSHPDCRPLHVAFWINYSLGGVEGDHSQFEFTDAIAKSGQAPSQLPAAWYAISINRLRGDTNMGIDNSKYTSFLRRTPVSTIGYCLYVYEIEAIQ